MVYRVWDEVSVLLLLHDAFAGLRSLVWSVVVVTAELASALSSFLHFLNPFRSLRPVTFFGNVQPRRNKLGLLNGIARRRAFLYLSHIFPGHSGFFLKGIRSLIGFGELLVEGIGGD